MADTRRVSLRWAVGALTDEELRKVDDVKFKALTKANQRLAVLEQLFDAVEYEIGIGTKLPHGIAVAWQGAAQAQERGG